MKKILSLLIVLAIVIAPSVFAGEIKTADASIDTNGKITVKGTTESSVVAVAVSIHDADGNFIKMVTGSVKDDDTYEVTADMEVNKYILKVADYHGGNFVEIEVAPLSDKSEGSTEEETSKVETTTEEVKSVNAKTFDAIVISFVIFAVCAVGVAFSAKYFLKRKQK